MINKNANKAYFEKLENITRSFGGVSQPLVWLDPHSRVMTFETPVSAEEREEQAQDKRLYTLYLANGGNLKPVAWNVPRIDKDIILKTVLKRKDVTAE